MTPDHNGSTPDADDNLPVDETALIDRIRRRFARPHEGILGIGDDAAILPGSDPLVATTDLLVEEVDFFTDTPLWFVGRKALTANLSDLAAMGAEPESFLLTIGTPNRSIADLDELIDGMAEKAAQWKIALVGGDLSRSERFLISITALGRLRNRSPLLRSSAKSGESLFVSRPLGAPAAGLKLLGRGWRLSREGRAVPPDDAAYETRELAASLLRAQLDPDPEVSLGLGLGKLEQVGACIDLSDGLSRDLARICAASGVGATVDWERLPIVSGLERLAIGLGLDPAACALHGGEEFSLLFSARATESEMSSMMGRPVYRIGRIEKEPGVRLLRGGRVAPLPPLGFDHFDAG